MSSLFSRLVKASTIVPLCYFLNQNTHNNTQNDHTSQPPHNRYDTASQEIETSIEQMYLAPLDYTHSSFKLFELDSGSLGKEVAAHMDVTIGSIQSERFNDGECNLQILNSIRGHNVYLIKGFGERNINDGVIELLLAVNTLKKEGAEKVTCIIPYFPYCQGVDYQVEANKELFTCFASDILKMLEDAGCNQVITFNSMMNSPKGFVNECSLVNIDAPDLFVGHLAFKRLRDPVLVSSHLTSPNLNSLHIMKNAMKYLNFDCPISTFNDHEYVG
jgi:phosphoribosylpyrophosphate synthetase